MKSFRSIAIAFFALFLLSSHAHAAIVHLSGAGDNLGLVSVGQTGSVSSPVLGSGLNSYDYLAIGLLPSNSMITFTFTASNVNLGLLTSIGQYSFGFGGSTAVASSTGPLHVSNVFPVLATANIAGGTATGTITIKNLSASIRSFGTTFLSLFSQGAGGSATVSYAVAATPLPSALMLFGAGLTGLGFIGKRRKAAASTNA